MLLLVLLAVLLVLQLVLQVLLASEWLAYTICGGRKSVADAGQQRKRALFLLKRSDYFSKKAPLLPAETAFLTKNAPLFQ